MGVGLVMVYSASFIYASETFGDGLHFFKRQLIFVGLGLAAMWLASLIPFILWRRLFWPLFVLLVVLLGSLFIPGIGHRAGGALRWIKLPFGFHLEPSELAKIFSPVLFAYWLSRERRGSDQQGQIYYYLGLALTILLPCFLMLKQPDFGSTVIFMLVGAAILFSFGLRWRYILGLVLAALPTFYFLVWKIDYRRARIESFINPWADPEKSGFQVIQSLLSVHSGGVTGTGLGKGQGKLFFLPEAHTDFILAILGEEAGWIGLLLVMGLYGWLVFRGFQVSVRCKSAFGKGLAVGLTSLIGFQAIINAGVVLGLLPTKGLTMPFLSYGGSSLVSMCIACGILLSIHRRHQMD
ncbi:MAG: putative lipid II flippase FtsW [Oligoflexia bacterium]|nr:putative lipid II flippase FtsW [Oligoflexia bacterium]